MNPGKLTLIRSLVAAAAVLGLVARTAAQAQSVNINSQLMITDLRVVEDPIRTNPRNGARAAWTFKSLMTAMAGRNDPSEFVMRWLKTWETDQVIHGSVARARPDIRRKVIDPWLKASGGKSLNLDIAPFKLLAIVNRIDLRAHESDDVATAGEGRFVFGLLGPDGKPLAPLLGASVNPGGFVVIFEYELVANTMAQLSEWTLLWANLGRFQLGTPQYNAALEAVTRRFTDRGRAPHKPNGSAINQIRSNELTLAEPWELREFRIQNGWMAPHGMAQTPDFIALNGTPAPSARAGAGAHDQGRRRCSARRGWRCRAGPCAGAARTPGCGRSAAGCATWCPATPPCCSRATGPAAMPTGKRAPSTATAR